MKIRNHLIRILLITNIILVSCQNKKQMNGYNYETGASCPTDYDIETYRQVMYGENNEMIMIDGLGTLRSPWGNGEVTVIKNDTSEKPIPKTLKIGYYSETENEFFEGEFQLPSQDIRKLFEEKSKFKSNEEQSKYNQIEIGIALGGMVAVWVKGKNNQTEVGRYYAEKVSRNWNDIFENGTQEEELRYNLEKIFTPKVKNEVLTKTLPTDLWEIYREKYKWNLNVVLPPGSKLENTHIKSMINAEAEEMGEKDVNKQARALPYNIEFSWLLNGKKYNSRIVFGDEMSYYNAIYKPTLLREKEEKYPADFRLQEVYKSFHQINGNEPSELLIKADQNGVAVTLKQDEKVIPFTKIIAKTFEQ